MAARVTWSWRSWGSVLKAMWPLWVECRQDVSVSSVCVCETRVHVLPSWKRYPTAVFKIELSWTQPLLACPLHSLSWKNEHRRWAKCMFFFFYAFICLGDLSVLFLQVITIAMKASRREQALCQSGAALLATVCLFCGDEVSRQQFRKSVAVLIWLEFSA